MKFSERYQIQKTLGRGAHGEVFLAQDRKRDHLVALKFLDQKAAGPDLGRRFQEEVRLLRGIQSPHLVRILSAGIEQGRLYYSMEYLSGRSLYEVLKAKGRLDLNNGAKLIGSIALGLQALHQVGVVHRDLKPGNVLLSERGIPKLTDLGLAKALTGSKVRTKTGMILGTPGYLAPEVLQGEKATPAADLYALGGIAFRTWAGREAFVGEHPMEIFQAQLRGLPPEAGSILPPEVRPLIERLLASTPGERPSVLEVLEFCQKLREVESSAQVSEIVAGPSQADGIPTVPQEAVSFTRNLAPPRSKSPTPPSSDQRTRPLSGAAPSAVPASALPPSPQPKDLPPPALPSIPSSAAPPSRASNPAGLRRVLSLAGLALFFLLGLFFWARPPASTPPPGGPPPSPVAPHRLALEDLDNRIGRGYAGTLRSHFLEGVDSKARELRRSQGELATKGPLPSEFLKVQFHGIQPPSNQHYWARFEEGLGQANLSSHFLNALLQGTDPKDPDSSPLRAWDDFRKQLPLFDLKAWMQEEASAPELRTLLRNLEEIHQLDAFLRATGSTAVAFPDWSSYRDQLATIEWKMQDLGLAQDHVGPTDLPWISECFQLWEGESEGFGSYSMLSNPRDKLLDTNRQFHLVADTRYCGLDLGEGRYRMARALKTQVHRSPGESLRIRTSAYHFRPVDILQVGFRPQGSKEPWTWLHVQTLDPAPSFRREFEYELSQSLMQAGNARITWDTVGLEVEISALVLKDAPDLDLEVRLGSLLPHVDPGSEASFLRPNFLLVGGLFLGGVESARPEPFPWSQPSP